MTNDCRCKGQNIMILSCSGASIVSQLAIQKDEGRSLSLEEAVPEDVAAVKFAARLALKLPVKIVFNSPTPLSPADQAMSRLLGGKCC